MSHPRKAVSKKREAALIWFTDKGKLIPLGLLHDPQKLEVHDGQNKSRGAPAAQLLCLMFCGPPKEL